MSATILPTMTGSIPLDLGQTLIACAALVTIIGVLYAFWRKWLLPKFEFLSELGDAARVTLLGHPEVRDPGNPSKVIEPGRPGALDRLGTLEDAVTLLVQSNARLADHDKMLADHGRLLADHEKQLALIHTQVLERLASHIDSAEGYRAIQAALTASPAPDAEDEVPAIENRDT